LDLTCSISEAIFEFFVQKDVTVLSIYSRHARRVSVFVQAVVGIEWVAKFSVRKTEA
jgi:hypothetical protein